MLQKMTNFDLNILQNYFINVTQQAAIACHQWIGRGDQKNADQAAVQSMRNSLNKMPINGKIVIGEGERDKAPMLFIGEKVGLQRKSDPEVDIAVDPLEGTNLCAKGAPGAICVLIVAPKNTLLAAPDVYMQKIVWGPQIPNNLLNLENSIAENIQKLTQFLQKKPSELKVIILDRPRHQNIIAELRKLYVKIILIDDGDIEASVRVALGYADLYLGTGGAPEGVIAASALKSLGGGMQGKLLFKDAQQREYASKIMNTENIDQIFFTNDLVKNNDFLFVASAVTNAINMSEVFENKGFWQVETLLLSHKKQENIISKIIQ